MRLAIKSFHDRLAHGSTDEAKDAYRAASIAIDHTSAKGVIHKKQAARRKSRLNAQLNAQLKAKATA